MTSSGTAQWDPDQYERFKAERARPFWDLVALVQPCPGGRVVDEDVHERRFGGDRHAGHVRRMIGVGRDLDRELASDR